MKVFHLFLTVLCAVRVCLCRGLHIPVNSTITHVSLFGDGALVTRQGSVQVPAGKTTLQFKNLPSKIDPTTLQVNFVTHNKGFVQNSKMCRSQPQGHENNALIGELSRALTEAQKQREKKTRRKKEAEEAITFATKVRNSFAEAFGNICKARDSNALGQAKEVEDFVTESHAAAYSKIDSAEAELKAIQQTIDKLGKEIHKANEVAELLSSVAEVEIEVDELNQVKMEITYLASTANWKPYYELRAFPGKGSLDISYLASIQQKTGEDWSNISLALHTNQVLRQGNVPELRPLHIRDPDQDHMHSTEETFNRKQLSHYAEGSSSLRNRPAIKGSTVSFEVTIPRQVTILSSHESTSYKVLEGSVNAEYWSETVPRLKPDAFLRAKIRNTLGIPILPGEAVTFVDGKLSSKVQLDETLPDVMAKVSLGYDGNVIVERTMGALKDSDSGFYIGPTKTLSREYKNVVTNLHQNAHNIVVVDQFPIAREEKIQIHRVEPTENDVSIEDDNNGIFQWNSTLAPQEKAVFVTSYDVVLPRDWSHISTEL